METLIPVIAGVIITFIIQLSKKWWISNRILLAVFVIIAAAIYTAYQYFVDEVTRAEVTKFTTSTLGSAVIFYEYFVRNLPIQSQSAVNKIQ